MLGLNNFGVLKIAFLIHDSNFEFMSNKLIFGLTLVALEREGGGVQE